MSDIKMSDEFDLPISYDFDFRDEYGVDHRVIQDANHKDVISDDTQLSSEQARLAVHAINTHDTMQASIVELEKAISGILNSPHTKLTKGALLEVSEVDIDAAIKALEK